MQVSKIKSFVDWLLLARPELKEVVYGTNKFERKILSKAERRKAHLDELNNAQQKIQKQWLTQKTKK